MSKSDLTKPDLESKVKRPTEHDHRTQTREDDGQKKASVSKPHREGETQKKKIRKMMLTRERGGKGRLPLSHNGDSFGCFSRVKPVGLSTPHREGETQKEDQDDDADTRGGRKFTALP